MDSPIDPNKLKVVELRNELSARGLDVKGTKPILVKRLKEALEKESENDKGDAVETDKSAEEAVTPRKSLRSSTEEKETRQTRNTPTSEKSQPVQKTPEKAAPQSVKDAEISSPEKTTPTQTEKNATVTSSPAKVTPASTPAKATPTASPQSSKITPTSSPQATKVASTLSPQATKGASTLSPQPVKNAPKSSPQSAKVVPTTSPQPVKTSPSSAQPVKASTPSNIPVSSQPLKSVPATSPNTSESKNVEAKPSATKVSEQTVVKPSTPVKKDSELESSIEEKMEPESPDKPKVEVMNEDRKSDDQANGEQLDKEAPMEVQDESVNSEKVEDDKNSGEEHKHSARRGEKRKHSRDDSPERPAKRQRSPIREDEPTLDAEAVQLSWFDSDLNLLIDKTTFLSARPLTEGAFGFMWGGARATYGVSSGQVCFEVKLTDKLKWEDMQRPEYHQYRTDHRRQRRDEKRDAKYSESKNDSKKTDHSKQPGDSEDKLDVPKENDDNIKKKEDISDSIEKTDNVETKEESMDTTPAPSDDATNTEESVKDKETMDTNEKKDENDVEEKSLDGDEKIKDNEENPKDDEKPKDGEEKPKDDEEKHKEPPLPTHFFRVGWSVATASLQLGEDKNSYGYESSGKWVKDNEFTEYGITFDTGDVVGAFLDITPTTVTIQYTVNGQIQPVINIPTDDLPENFVLYPHILTRNYAFEVNFGQKEEPWFANPTELSNYQYVDKSENKVPGPSRPEARSDCEVIMMFGLIGSGKTHWVSEHVSANTDKKYTVIGNTMVNRMTVSGQPLKSVYKGKWYVFLDKLEKCLNKLINMAALRRRNCIIDQSNTYPSAQRRKLRPFEGFKRKAVVVIVGDEEQNTRLALQETQEGKETLENSVLEMKAGMTLPVTGDWLDEILYVGLEENDAKEMIKKYNADGKAAGFGPERRYNKDKWNYEMITVMEETIHEVVVAVAITIVNPTNPEIGGVHPDMEVAVGEIPVHATGEVVMTTGIEITTETAVIHLMTDLSDSTVVVEEVGAVKVVGINKILEAEITKIGVVAKVKEAGEAKIILQVRDPVRDKVVMVMVIGITMDKVNSLRIGADRSNPVRYCKQLPGNCNAQQQQPLQIQQQPQQQTGYLIAKATGQTAQYDQTYNAPEAWAQYAQQYAQHQQMVQSSVASTSAHTHKR